MSALTLAYFDQHKPPASAHVLVYKDSSAVARQ